jgi:hypothetical protein
MSKTLPPEMLPQKRGEVWVCSCEGKNEMPCPLCWRAFDGERELPEPTRQ